MYRYDEAPRSAVRIFFGRLTDAIAVFGLVATLFVVYDWGFNNCHYTIELILHLSGFYK